MDVQKRTNGNCGNCVFNVNFGSFLRRRKTMRKVMLIGLTVLFVSSLSFASTAAYWRFEEGADGNGGVGQCPTTAHWVTEQVNNSKMGGTANQGGGGPLYVTTTASNAPGNLAMQFNDDNYDYVTIPNDAAINFGENESYTIELFVRIDGASSDGSTTNFILSKDYADSSHHGWAIYWNDGTGKISAQFSSGVVTSTTSVNDGNWHHIAINHAANSETYDLYVDYNKEDTLTGYSSGAVSGGYLYFGRGFG